MQMKVLATAGDDLSAGQRAAQVLVAFVGAADELSRWTVFSS